MGRRRSRGHLVHRWMVRVDMPEILNIERESFAIPWNEEDFLLCLRQRNCFGRILEQNDKVLGFIIFEWGQVKIRIINCAVAPTSRRLRIGSMMVRKLTGRLSKRRQNSVMLEVRETNLEAQLFFRALGFKAIQVLRGFCDDTGEDVFVMRYSIFDSSRGRKSTSTNGGC